MSTLADAIATALNKRLNRVLSVAQVGIPTAEQYKAFRSILLDEFGNAGFLPELETLLQSHLEERNGTGRPRLQERRCHHE